MDPQPQSQTQTVSNHPTYVLCSYYTFNNDKLLINYTRENMPIYTKLKCSTNLNEVYSAFLNAMFDDNIYAEAFYVYQTLIPYINEDIGFLVKSVDHAEAHKLKSILWYYKFVSNHSTYKTNVISVDKSMWNKLSSQNQQLTNSINKNFIELCSMKKKDLYDLAEPKKKYFKWLSRMYTQKNDLIYDLLCKRYIQDKKKLE